MARAVIGRRVSGAAIDRQQHEEHGPSEGCPPHARPDRVRKDPKAESLIQRFGRSRCVHVVWRIAGLYLGKEFPDAYPCSFAPGNVRPGC